MYIQVNELPSSIQNALKSVSYNKKDISVSIKETESVFCSGGEGRKGFALIVNISSGEIKELWGSWGGSNMFNPTNQVDLNDKHYPIPENIAIILGSIGDKTYASITFSPKNILPVLNAKPEVNKEEKDLLKIFLEYKASYRKPYLIGKEELIESLIGREFLSKNKAGAIQITTQGKNAAK